MNQPTQNKRPEKRKAEQSSRISYKERNKLKGFGLDTENYVYRVVNSDDSRYAGRVANLEKRGYAVVTNEQLGEDAGVEAHQIGSVTSRPVGHGVKGVLMRIPREFYEEDQRQKQAEVDDTEKGMVDDELLNATNTYGEGLTVGRNRPKVEVQQN